MKRIIVLSAFFLCGTAFANPGVTKNTDIGKRDVKSHNQVTRCEGDKCTINDVTKFNKSVKGKKIYRGECVFNEVDDMRVSQCKTDVKKRKAKTKTVIKERVIDNTKKNRIQLHIGYGPDGLDADEDNNKTSVEERRRVIMGFQYTRSLKDGISIGGSVFTNKTVTATLGFDY